jgi:hypothetical protein
MRVFIRDIPDDKATAEVLAPYQTADYELQFGENSVVVWALI